MKTNADDLARSLDRRVAAFDGVVRKAIAKGALEIEKAATANLSGASDAAPYSYPVPTPTGHLRGSMDLEQPLPVMAIVYNDAAYAWAVHSGDVNEWRSHYAGAGDDTMVVSRRPREFLDDAVRSTPVADMVIAHVSAALQAGAIA